MTCTLWLIVEDEHDGEAIKALLTAKRLDIKVKVKQPTGGSGGISRLARSLNENIRTAKAQMKASDCIVVLHDWDIQKQQHNRDHYRKIEDICRQEAVQLVIAHDELEAWLLADEGLCKWLGINPKQWDSEPKPSDTLRSLLQRHKKLKYQGRNRQTVYDQLDGSGDKYSESIRDAYRRLMEWQCLE
jgi:hypothetical protein